MKPRFYAASLLFFLSTLCGWAQWTPATSGTTSNLNGVRLLDSGVGFAMGDAGVILKTTDAGTTWTPLSSGTTRALHDVYFFNESEGVAVGDNGLILRTSDGGATWPSVSSGVRDSLGTTCNGQNITLTLEGAEDDQGNTLSVSTTMGLLLGDVSGDGVVDEADVSQTEAAVGQRTDSSNFRADLDVSGQIDKADLRRVRAKLGSMLPP